MRFNFNQVRAFVTAAETLSFTLAADRTHVAQPTFSGTIRSLEEEMGVKLFERSSRTVRLSRMGLEFLPMARKILDEVDSATAAMSDLVSIRNGAVRFSSLPSLFTYHLPAALIHFRNKWPGVKLELLDYQSAQALQQLRSERIELAIITDTPAEKDVQWEMLCEISVVAVLREDHSLARAAVPITWSRLLEESLIGLQWSGPMGHYVDRMLRQAGLKYVPEYKVDQVPTLLGIVQAGLGIGVTSSTMARALERDGLVVRHLENPHIRGPVNLAYLSQRELSPAAKQLRASIFECWPAEDFLNLRKK